MERDLGRLRATGFDGVLLSVAPSDLAEPAVVEAITRFLSLSSRQSPIFQVGLLLSPSAPMTLREENVTAYLQKHGLLHSPAMMQLNGKTFIGFDSLVSLQPAANSDCSVRCLGKDWPSLPADPGVAASSLGADGVIWIRVAGHGQGATADNKAGTDQRSWALARADGKNFALALQQAFAARPSIVLVSSWNNYLDGSFMEPNTLDQDVMSQTMRKELRRAGF